jgi:hypothetical protein
MRDTEILHIDYAIREADSAADLSMLHIPLDRQLVETLRMRLGEALDTINELLDEQDNIGKE